MSSKILSIIERAYHGTIEEQDDTAIWFSHACKNAGAELTLLLRGNAVNYLLKGQDASGLAFGGLSFGKPPKIDRDLEALLEQNAKLFAVEEDLEDRGVSRERLLNGVKVIPQKEVVHLFDQADQIWHW